MRVKYLAESSSVSAVSRIWFDVFEKERGKVTRVVVDGVLHTEKQQESVGEQIVEEHTRKDNGRDDLLGQAQPHLIKWLSR